MAVPWLRLIDAAFGIGDLVRGARGRPPRGETQSDPSGLQMGGSAVPGGPLEARLAGVVVAALKEAFDRDTHRLQLERDQLEAERERAERALRLELIRQAGDREIGRLRLLAGLAAASWLGTLLFAARLAAGTVWPRVSLGIGWLLLLAALGAAFSAQSSFSRALARIGDSRDLPSPGFAGAVAPWLIVAGLGVIALGVLIAG